MIGTTVPTQPKNQSKQPRPLVKREILIFAATSILVAVLTRVLVLPLSVIDHDESAYFLVSRDFLNGLVPYEGGFDHKPVFLYYSFALAQIFFGQNVIAIRLLAICAVACTSFLIALFLRRASMANSTAAAGAGIVYAIMSPLSGGLATNTEILLNVYAVAALILLTTGKITSSFVLRTAVTSGIILGFMVHTNYLSGPLAVALVLAHIATVTSILGAKKGLRTSFWNVAFIAIGFCVSTTLLLTPIFLWGDIGGYFSDQFNWLKNYRTSHSTRFFLGHVLPVLHTYSFPLALFVAAVCLSIFSNEDPRNGISPNRLVARQILIYLIFCFASYIASGQYYPHYFILSLPPLCIGIGLFLLQVPRTETIRRLCVVCLIIVSVLSLVPIRHWYERGFNGWAAWAAGRPPDLPSKIAFDVRERLEAHDLIYVYDYQPILYGLTGTKLPNKYFFPPDHLRKRHGQDPAKEMANILVQSPKFIIAGRDPAKASHGEASRLLHAAINSEYKLFREYSESSLDSIRVYERR